MQLSLHCDSVASALHRALEINSAVGSPENMHFADVGGNACVVEATNSHFALRRSGENGESDYLHATNYFVSPDMQDSKPSDLRRTKNAVSRFITENRLLQDTLGHITLDTLERIITCREYFDGQQWVRNVWDRNTAPGRPKSAAS